ncbi:hypothetical protein BDN70DRAFT_883749 [Pholiota conissans]|uniref:Uncharacterized protein n=1 Tax=Pholiota conissans TaxID=109636 RepID=A0A9P6CQ39_9AGAR|nr:hypothetical protein BDN70DRAFT_883749 [Pholiota conissans]
MKSIFATAAAAAVLLAGNALAQLTVNTPGPAVVCQPLLISWTGGTPPYFLSVLPGNQPTAAALIDFGQQTGTQLTWTVNITAGTSLGLNLRDSTGTLAQSGVFTVQASSDTSCLTSSGSTTSPTTGTTTGTTTGGSTTAPTTAPTTTPTTPATTPTTRVTTPPATSTTKASTSGTTSASTTTTSSAASGNMANAGLAGAFGIGAAIMALVL